jgi:hypothetical protein
VVDLGAAVGSAGRRSGNLVRVDALIEHDQRGESLLDRITAAAADRGATELAAAHLFGTWFAKLSSTTSAVLARIGGLLLTTIRTRLALGGIRTSTNREHRRCRSGPHVELTKALSHHDQFPSTNQAARTSSPIGRASKKPGPR